MKELMYIRSFSKRHLSVIMGTLLLVIIGSVWLNTATFRSGFEITDELGGNIFPSSILSVATTDAQVSELINQDEATFIATFHHYLHIGEVRGVGTQIVFDRLFITDIYENAAEYTCMTAFVHRNQHAAL